MQDYEKAKCLLTSGELEEACHLFTNFIESHKDSTEHRTTVTAAYNSRGHAKYLSVDFPGAIEDHSVAIQRDPHFTIAWYNRGQVHYRLGEFNIIEIAHARIHYACAKSSIGRYKTAEEDLKKALELQPDFTDAQLNLTQVQKDIQSGHCFITES